MVNASNANEYTKRMSELNSVLRKMSRFVDEHEYMALRLNSAARDGHLDEVKMLVKTMTENAVGITQRCSVFEACNKALVVAASCGQLDVAAFLLENGADIHDDDNLALRSSAERGDVEVTMFLIEHGADIHDGDDYPLQCFAEQGNLDMVKYLISIGADVFTNNGALQYSAAKGRLDVVEYLVEQGADIHTHGECALQYSAINGHVNVMAYLIECGADFRADDDYVLHISASKPRLHSLQWLMYEVCYGQSNDFEFKYRLIQNHAVASIFKEEYDRRCDIRRSIKEQLYKHALGFHLRPTSLRVYYMGVHFGRHLSDCNYWE